MLFKFIFLYQFLNLIYKKNIFSCNLKICNKIAKTQIFKLLKFIVVKI